MQLALAAAVTPVTGRRLVAAAAFMAAFTVAAPARAQDGDPTEILKAMSDYLAEQTVFAFSFESAVEAVTKDFEKLQFVSSGSVTVNRPDKIRVTRTGGFIDAELVFDGSTLTVYGRNLNAYAQVEGTATLDEIGEQLADVGAEPPGADLLVSDVFDVLTDGVTDAKHVGTANVHGVPCEYLAFRKADVDFQIWIAIGERPVPVRYALTSKHEAQAPQYAVEISDWRFGEEVGPADFEFDPGSARKVDLSAIEMLDELPSPTGGEDEQ